MKKLVLFYTIGLLLQVGCYSRVAQIPKKYVRAKSTVEFTRIKICILNDVSAPVDNARIKEAFTMAATFFPKDFEIAYCIHGTYWGDFNLPCEKIGTLTGDYCSDADYRAIVTNKKMLASDIKLQINGGIPSSSEIYGTACYQNRFMVIYNFENNMNRQSTPFEQYSYTAGVTAHEIGHLLGVVHNNSCFSVMNPSIDDTVMPRFLWEDLSIMRLYRSSIHRIQQIATGSP